MSTLEPSRKVSLVVFDLDGTLVDAFHAIADSINFMLAEMGLPPQGFLKIKRSVGWGVNSLVNSFVDARQVPRALRIFRAHHDQRLRQKIKLLPGVKSLLPFLKEKGCVLAVASNRPSVFCHIIMKQAGIDHYFDHVICGDLVKRPKPYPDMIQEILKASKKKPSQTLYVGDMTVDVECGRRARVLTLAIPTGSCTKKELKKAKPHRLIRRISEVRRFV
ncbi:MAG: HAD family hydrolase [Candidatus Omnitrophica bacterium]|nr:HAD family hydrolase [Candidatus Omnitrophota bacterium]